VNKKPSKGLTFGGRVATRLILWQIERPHQEHRHLGTRDRVFGAVVAAAAASCDVLGGQLFDPGGGPMAGRYVIETGA